jgi:hypothetical protein
MVADHQGGGHKNELTRSVDDRMSSQGSLADIPALSCDVRYSLGKLTCIKARPMSA